MNQFNSLQFTPKPKLIVEPSLEDQKKSECLKLANELVASPEAFTFPGMSQESYFAIKSTEIDSFPFVAPIDDVIEKMKQIGMRLSLGNPSTSGNVYALPFDSNDVTSDGVLIQDLQMGMTRNPKLEALILMVQDIVKK